MAPTEYLFHRITTSVDVELPLGRPSTPACDLPLSDVAALTGVQGDPAFHPSLSQVAADLSLARMRWPGRSRPGYHGASSGWNWMRDGRVGFGERTVPGC